MFLYLYIDEIEEELVLNSDRHDEYGQTDSVSSSSSSMSYVMHKRLTCDFSAFKRCGFVRHVKGAYLLSSDNRLSRRSEPVRSNGLYETVLLVDNLFLSLKLEYNNNIDFKV